MTPSELHQCLRKGHLIIIAGIIPMKLNSFLFALFFAVTPVTARADVVLPKIFSSNMVLQRELALPIWGMADAGENVTVKFRT